MRGIRPSSKAPVAGARADERAAPACRHKCHRTAARGASCLGKLQVDTAYFFPHHTLTVVDTVYSIDKGKAPCD